MEISSLKISITQSFRPEFQEFYVCCRFDGKDFHSREIFEKDDLHSTFDRMFDSAKMRIKQMLELDLSKNNS
jgi:hypothetical protein